MMRDRRSASSRAWPVVSAALLTVSPDLLALEWPGQAEQIAELYESLDVETRVAAIGRLRSGSEVSMQLLEAASHDPAHEVRAAVAAWIAATGAREAESLAISLLADRRASVRVEAASALGELRTPSALEPLVRSLGDADADVRTAAVEALASLGRPEAVLALVEVTHDPSRDVVVAALQALGRLGDTGAIFAVLEKMNDPVEAVAAAAAEAAGRMRADEAVPGLIELVLTGRAVEVQAATEALARIGSRAATPVLVSELVNPRHPEAAEAIADALRQLRDPAAVNALVPYLGSHIHARDVVVAAGPGAWEPLRRAWSLGNHAVARQTLLQTWLQTGDPEAVAAIRAFAGQAESDAVSMAALYALSPTETGFCTSVSISPPTSIEMWDAVFERAVASNAGNCFVELVLATERHALPPVAGIAGVLAATGYDDPAGVLAEVLDVERLTGNDAAELAAVLLTQGEAAASTLLPMLASSDVQVVREAAWAMSELEGQQLDAATVADLAERAERTPEIGGAFAGFVRGPHSMQVITIAQSWLVSERPELSAEAFGILAGACSALSDSALREHVASEDFWVRGAAVRAALACQRDEIAAGAAGLPGSASLLPASTQPHAIDAEHFRQLGNDEQRVLLLEVLAAAATLDQATEGLLRGLVHDAAPQVRAAALLTLAGLGADLEPGALALVALASDSLLERQVIAHLLRQMQADNELARVVRGDSTGELARIGTDAEPVLGTPLTIGLVDASTGRSMPWQSVFVVWADLRFSLERSDSNGVVRVREPGVVIVRPLGLER